MHILAMYWNFINCSCFLLLEWPSGILWLKFWLITPIRSKVFKHYTECDFFCTPCYYFMLSRTFYHRKSIVILWRAPAIKGFPTHAHTRERFLLLTRPGRKKHKKEKNHGDSWVFCRNVYICTQFTSCAWWPRYFSLGVILPEWEKMFCASFARFHTNREKYCKRVGFKCCFDGYLRYRV